MGNPKAFETPAYDFLFRRNFEFEKYGRKDIYWIELDYYIDRDYFVSRIGRALDVEMRSYGGLPIFEGAIDKEYIAAQNMVLLKETISPQYAYQDVYKVTELYGFAPNVTFEKYGAAVSTVWGREDPNATLEKQTANTGFSIYKSTNQICVPMLSEADASQFAVGDVVKIRGDALFLDPCCNGWVYKSNGSNVITEITHHPTTVSVDAFESNPSTISKISGRFIFCEIFSIGTGEADEAIINRLNYFFLHHHAYGQYSQIHRSKYLVREFMQRAARQRISNYVERIEYSNLKPQITERFAPLSPHGAEVDIITPSTRPPISEWLRKVANGEEIVSADSKIEELYQGLWIKSTKYTKAR